MREREIDRGEGRYRRIEIQIDKRDRETKRQKDQERGQYTHRVSDKRDRETKRQKDRERGQYTHRVRDKKDRETKRQKDQERGRYTHRVRERQRDREGNKERIEMIGRQRNIDKK